MCTYLALNACIEWVAGPGLFFVGLGTVSFKIPMEEAIEAGDVIDDFAPFAVGWAEMSGTTRYGRAEVAFKIRRMQGGGREAEDAAERHEVDSEHRRAMARRRAADGQARGAARRAQAMMNEAAPAGATAAQRQASTRHGASMRSSGGGG